MRKLFLCAAVLLLFWLGVRDERHAKSDRQTTDGNSSTLARGDRLANADIPQQSLSPSPVNISTDKTLVDSNLSTEATEFAIRNLTGPELRARLDKLSTQTEPTAAEMRQLLIRRWAEGDASGAAAWATQFSEGSIRNDVLEQVAVAWVNTNATNAINWLQTLPDGESKQIAMLAAAYEVARVNPLTALNLASELPPGHDRDALLEHAASQWASDNFSAAADWAEQISDTELREKLLAAIAVAAASNNAPDAASLIATLLGPGETQARAAVAITQRWAQFAPLNAAAWISQFPEMPARDAAVNNLVGLWAASDSEATVNWLNSLPAGSFRDVGVRAFGDNSPP